MIATVAVAVANIVSFTALAADPTPAPAPAAPVEKVVVFADRAEVTRAQTAKCEGGSAAAVFAGLPESIDPRTLRGEAEGEAVAVGVQSQKVALEEARDETVRTLQKQLQDVDDQLATIARAEADDQERAHTMLTYGAYFRALAVEEMRDAKPEQSRWDTMLDALSKDQSTLLSSSVARAAEQRTLQRKRERLQARLDRLSPAASPSVVQATVAVQCNGAAQAKVRLSYVLPGATWHPEYDLRFTGPAKAKVGDGKAVVTVAGVVTQSSGEDWTDAEIWLSTAKPNLGGEAPLPNPIYVSGYEEQKTKTLVQAQEHRAEDLKTGKNTGTVTAQGATLEDGGKAFVLKLPKKVTVRADGRPYWFPVDDVTANAKSAVVVEPGHSPYAFQIASLDNPAPYPLMAGVMHVFRGATYVGNTAIEYRAPGEPMEVSLGIDEEISIERQDLLKQKREAGLLSGSQTIAHSYRTIIRNRADDDVTVELREQIPVSKSADIEVTVQEADTAGGYKLDKLRGHLTWQVPLKKGASDKRDLSFTIKLPKDWHVQ